MRDYADIKANGAITQKVANEALAMLNVDERGLDQMDRNYLRAIAEKYSGGPVGIETLASALSEEKETLEDVYEPYLIQCGFLNRTSRGRVLTDFAYRHLGLEPIKKTGDSQLTIF